MIISSKNFAIELGNGDMLCIGDVFSKTDIAKNHYGEIINGEDFLKKVAVLALTLAEEDLETGKIKERI